MRKIGDVLMECKPFLVVMGALESLVDALVAIFTFLVGAALFGGTALLVVYAIVKMVEASL